MKATLNKDCAAVAAGIAELHMETSILTYNDENALSCTIVLAYYYARECYMVFREFPGGKGFADVVYVPRKNYDDKPAIVVELKWNRSAKGAIDQIKEKAYVKALENYDGKVLLVGINYDVKTKEHQCEIEDYIF